ncbi:MAG TPA: hypothetical protein PLD47_04085 [Aggregatilineales bacterium]|nr:hypothetical protein [Anaerolineales bacterium]HRE46881.1 hypothetical protein [Aggregatilineales bacterium]
MTAALPTNPAHQRPPYSGAVMVMIVGVVIYLGVAIFMALPMSALYRDDPNVLYAPSHFNDARQYAYICTYGYNVPFGLNPALEVSRMNWMPVYAALQCALNRVFGVSLIYAGSMISVGAIALSLFLGTLVLFRLGVQSPSLHAGALLIPPIGAAWLYLPGAEAIYLAVGMVVMWLITLPDPPDTPRGRIVELASCIGGLCVGVILILTKPNGLAMIAPLVFAFVYLSWRRSQRGGYLGSFGAFAADVVIEHLLFLPGFRRLARRPIAYHWTPLAIAVGILLGFAHWLAFSSVKSGIPNYFMQQQLNVWGRVWYPGNVGDMIRYFGQGFRGDLSKAWRYNALWNLAANLSTLIPAASPRVPPLIRGMLPLMMLLLVYSGAVHGSERYILSSALAAIGWGCWLAPTGKEERWSALRWTLWIVLAALSSWLLVGLMMPIGEPRSWGIIDR